MDKRFPLEDQIAMLASSLRGRVVTPADADYDAMRALVPANYDGRPAAVIRVANASDIAAIVNFADATGLPLSVRAGGHSAGGFGTNDGGIVIDLRGLNRIDVDPVARTVWAGAGLTAGEVTHALAPYGLIVGFGDTPSVGIGGLTLGGGIGYLVRKHGLTIDSLLAAEIVLANGDIVVADEANHPDLFWALRGGGGNFGVVTRFKYRLHPLPEFTGGPLVLPATAETIVKFTELAAAAPESLSAIASVMRAPPLPFLPVELHGKLVFLAMMAFAGSPDAADAALAPFRALGAIADLVAPGPYTRMFMEKEGRMSFALRSRFVEAVGPAEAHAMIEAVSRSEAMVPIAEIRVLGGAMARTSPEATAFAHRRSRIMTSFIAVFGDPGEDARHDRWAADSIATLQAAEDRVYVNFLSKDGPHRMAAAYPAATWDRLRQVKAKYDPDNLFSRNRNVPPS